MQIIVLIPASICILLLFRVSAQKVFQDLYLPVLLMVPTYYYWKVAALPPIDFGEGVLIPLGVAILFKEIRYWRFSPMDLWVAAFIFTYGYADNLKHRDTASTFAFFSAITTAGIPYMAAKLLIERDGGRVETVKRIVFCLFIVTIIASYEYKMGRNPFLMAMGPLFPDENFGWITQIRWGFGRVAGPFGQSELAGMVLLTALIFALWLSYYNLWEPKFKHAAWLPSSKARIISWTLFVGLLITQARGPWIGAALGVPVAMIGRSKNMLRSALLVLVFGAIGGAVLYVGLKAYTSGPVESGEQENAAYRAHLLDNYLPVVSEGGAWGWGPTFPRQAGQVSVDNEYLFVALTQGFVGFTVFCLICLKSIVNLVQTIILTPQRIDQYFALSLLGIFLGIMFIITTVFLGNQCFTLFFLLAGWTEALRFSRPKQAQLSFVQVFT